MRENIGIYRGKRIDTGEWKEGYLHGVQDRLTGKDLFFIVDENNESHRVNPETIGEYTGLTDSNGTGIFEGDIIKHENPGWEIKYGVINFGKYGVTPDNPTYNIGFYVNWLNDPFVRQDLGFWLEQRGIENIGNIYDNPELLGGADNEAD